MGDTQKSKEQLVQEIEEMQMIFDTIPATIWYKDNKNNLIKVNKITPHQDLTAKAFCKVR